VKYLFLKERCFNHLWYKTSGSCNDFYHSE